jgi:hypothetical protein
VSTEPFQRGSGENGQSGHPDGASDELTAEIPGLREEIAGLRLELSRLNETLTTRETERREEQSRRPARGVIAAVQTAADRGREWWRAYRE